MSTETHLSKEIEKVLVTGDLARLTPEERLDYYKAVCESIGLNPLTNPFDYIMLNGKLRLYAKKDATDQLRRIYDISVEDLKHDFRKDLELYIVTASGHGKEGRSDVSTGAVSIGGLRADALANAIMKAETKAKRRLTLSLCGLGVLDETELETISENQTPVVAVPSLPEVPKVDQTPAVGTDAPRPGEVGYPGHSNIARTSTGATVEEKKEAAIAAVPDLKPASELPAPKKRGRKPKESPENGQPVPHEIDDKDLDQIGTPAPPEVDHEATAKEAAEFVDSVTNFTSEEAAAAGLPEPPEYSRIPTKGSEEMKLFTARVRALTAAGALGADVKNYILASGKKSEVDKLTARDWDVALIDLENALKEGKLKEVTKNAPLPDKF